LGTRKTNVPPSPLFPLVARAQHRKERFLRDFHLAELLAALLAFFLLFEQPAFAGDVAARTCS